MLLCQCLSSEGRLLCGWKDTAWIAQDIKRQYTVVSASKFSCVTFLDHDIIKI